tara:strand:- start:12503 stop:13039 length:537 start_codon:yes stop_codon:yes gene_type:complete
MRMIWKTIEDELTGEFARGYALAQFIGCDKDMRRNTLPKSISYEWGDFEDYGGDTSPYEFDDSTGYIICTDEEANDLAYEYIVDSLWAFTPSFLAGETGVDIEVFEALAANGKCQSNNDAIASLIKATQPKSSFHCPLQDFVDSAIGADGRGHFLAHYDHEEHEVKVGDKTFYIYRVN